jgi:hypothetical protein
VPNNYDWKDFFESMTPKEVLATSVPWVGNRYQSAAIRATRPVTVGRGQFAAIEVAFNCDYLAPGTSLQLVSDISQLHVARVVPVGQGLLQVTIGNIGESEIKIGKDEALSAWIVYGWMDLVVLASMLNSKLVSLSKPENFRAALFNFKTDENAVHEDTNVAQQSPITSAKVVPDKQSVPQKSANVPEDVPDESNVVPRLPTPPVPEENAQKIGEDEEMQLTVSWPGSAAGSHKAGSATSSNQAGSATGSYQAGSATSCNQAGSSTISGQGSATSSHQARSETSSHQVGAATGSHQAGSSTGSHQARSATSSNQAESATDSHQAGVAIGSHQGGAATSSVQAGSATSSHQPVSVTSYVQEKMPKQPAKAPLNPNRFQSLMDHAPLIPFVESFLSIFGDENDDDADEMVISLVGAGIETTDALADLVKDLAKEEFGAALEKQLRAHFLEEELFDKFVQVVREHDFMGVVHSIEPLTTVRINPPVVRIEMPPALTSPALTSLALTSPALPPAAAEVPMTPPVFLSTPPRSTPRSHTDSVSSAALAALDQELEGSFRPGTQLNITGRKLDFPPKVKKMEDCLDFLLSFYGSRT